MILEEHLPRSAAGDERLHQGALGLDGVHQVVGSPLMDHLAEGDRSKFAVDGGTLEDHAKRAAQHPDEDGGALEVCFCN